MATDSDNRRQFTQPYSTSSQGAIYYTPRIPQPRRLRTTAPATFPTPHIRPRQRRPHSIHITSFPPGYIPRDLRPPSPRLARPIVPDSPPKPSSPRRSLVVPAVSVERSILKIISKISSVLTSPSQAHSRDGKEHNKGVSPSRTRVNSRPVSLLSIGSRVSAYFDTINDQADSSTSVMVEAIRPQHMANMSSTTLSSTTTIHGVKPHRNSIMSVRSAKNIMSSSVSEVNDKPVASGSGLVCSILLAEPNVFLTGFDHDGQSRGESQTSTALLRGKLQLCVSKNVKIKSIALKLLGRARTEWPEGIPPLKVDIHEEETLRTQVLTFFHALHESWETPYGNQCTYIIKGGTDNTPAASLARATMSPNHSSTSLASQNRPRPHSGLTAKELRRLSLQSVQSRSFGKGESPMAGHVPPKGYKVFYPGIYEYSFELPIDHHQLETTKLQYGSVKWELETTVERAGAFKPNLHGTREVSIVRVPDQLSLEMTEPISISRQWEDQLHYDIMISGKSFPIGTKIPIAFKLTPLAKVQVHKLKVFVTESIEYWTNDRRVTRKDPGRKILLLEKAAGKPLDKQFESSEVRVLSGGELSTEQRSEARAAATRRRNVEAQRAHTAPLPLPEPTENLLGDLELGLETYWGSTEIEMNVQIPTCEQMAKDKSLSDPELTTGRDQIVMRISRLDAEDPAGKRRRHFEISIDSPFTVLNCRSTQANTALPQYSGLDPPGGYRQHTACGCPDAEVTASHPSPASSTGTLPTVEGVSDGVQNSALPMPPQAAHIHSPSAGVNVSTHSAGTGGSVGSAPVRRMREQEIFQPRPIHLLRVPSYNPPDFDADDPPPPLPAELMTPPPNYDAIVGTPSVDGLADYFARLADYEDPSQEREGDEDSDSGDEPARLMERSGRVNVANPRTPGGRLIPSRSLEIERPVMTLSMADVVRRGERQT
ncbi:uncharacterized protein E0L32_006450 [Thyridium curvatum]|uniref:Arrestin C-terminal-like domain-containing protein n=1 Tax=Thyridium curvatum TaxID=1093900 RepID=A0A507B2S1_9PEZI|nr:uncharacterized protein E0L32_006450 [Thyridium curvatum]TPX13024.1 hypothetical protein E0L32_006450 [Thyridium curvatum]